MSKKAKEKIKEIISSEFYIPMTPPELHTFCGEDEFDAGDFFDTLCKMEENIEICVTKNGKIASPEACGYIRGVFSASARGRFGFVITESGDFFIPPKFTMTAMDKDEVLIRRISVKSGYKRNGNEAEVYAILKRNTEEFTGTFRGYSRAGRMLGEVVADDARLDIRASVSGLDKVGAEDGDKVVVKITKYPSYEGDSFRGKITDVLGRSDTLEANYLSVLYENGIATEFDQKVLDEAEESASQSISAEGRLDLRDKIIFTIDGADAKDLDDAISIEKSEDVYVLGVHIADVSHYVKEKTLLDKEAMARGTSVYFTDKVVPMLPKSLSNGACSLNAGEDRYALSAFMTVDKSGEILSTSLHNSIVRSKVRGVYSELNDILEKDTESEFYGKYAHVLADFQIMTELYSILRKKSLSDGAMELESDECKIELDKNGHPVSIIKRERGESEKLIEQFMLCANRGVAEYLRNLEMPCVYRVHESPDTEKTDAFIKFASNLGINCSSVRLGRTPSPKQLSTLLSDAEGMGISDVVSSVLLRSMMKAKYSSVPKPHYGLATELYCHFTSPIRRYPDLSVHRIVKSVIGGKIDADRIARLEAFATRSAEASSENELRALYAERGIDELYKTVYLMDRIGEEADGVISSITSFGFFVRTEDMCEGLVPLTSLSGDFFFDEENYTLVSKDRIFRLGQKVRIIISEADIISRKATFTLVSCDEAIIPKERRAPEQRKLEHRSSAHEGDRRNNRRDFRKKCNGGRRKDNRKGKKRR